MTIKHHLNEPLLMAYSAGTLPEGFSLVAATHISMCDECRARLASYDAMGGSMLERCEPAGIGDSALAATLALIDGMGSELGQAPGHPVVGAVLPEPLRTYVGGGVDAIRWRSVGGGVKQALLDTAGPATARLFRIPAGASVPDHGHRGIELTLVLRGAFRDETDRFGRGDVEIADEHMEHTPVAEAGEDCICLAATDAPLRFNALLPRLAQRFLRI